MDELPLKRLTQPRHVLSAPESESIILKGREKRTESGDMGRLRIGQEGRSYFFLLLFFLKKKESFTIIYSVGKTSMETNKEGNPPQMKIPSQTI